MGRSPSLPPSSPATRKMLVTSAEGEMLLLGQLFLYFVIMIIILALCGSTFDMPGPVLSMLNTPGKQVFLLFLLLLLFYRGTRSLSDPRSQCPPYEGDLTLRPRVAMTGPRPLAICEQLTSHGGTESKSVCEGLSERRVSTAQAWVQSPPLPLRLCDLRRVT